VLGPNSAPLRGVYTVGSMKRRPTGILGKGDRPPRHPARQAIARATERPLVEVGGADPVQLRLEATVAPTAVQLRLEATVAPTAVQLKVGGHDGFAGSQLPSRSA
jgi:hypothetical protein